MTLKSELNFEPGTQYQYSNGAYALLANIIEQVSGESLKSIYENIYSIPYP